MDSVPFLTIGTKVAEVGKTGVHNSCSLAHRPQLQDKGRCPRSTPRPPRTQATEGLQRPAVEEGGWMGESEKKSLKMGRGGWRRGKGGGDQGARKGENEGIGSA